MRRLDRYVGDDCAERGTKTQGFRLPSRSLRARPATSGFVGASGDSASGSVRLNPARFVRVRWLNGGCDYFLPDGELWSWNCVSICPVGSVSSLSKTS